MAGYLGRRVIDLLVTLWGVSTIVFVVLRLSGDPVALLATETATEEEIEQLRRSLGFTDPLYVQYARFLRGALLGDFGDSLRYFKPATRLVLETLPGTIQLTLLALTISVLVAFPLGTLAAVRANSWVDGLVTVGAVVGQSLPFYWLGILFILLFAVRLGWLPSGGGGSLAHFVLPALTLATYSIARTTRLVRTNMIEVLRQDYIRVARAKGLDERSVILRHAVRNAAIPIVTMFGLEFGTLIGGAVVTETIFSWPGIGRLSIQAIQGRDYPIVQAAVFYAAVMAVLANFLVDFLYTVLDPRVQVR